MGSRDKTIKKLGLRIRQMREAAGLTQEVLAEKSDLDITYVSGIERGLRNPSVLTLLALAEGSNTTGSKLLEDISG